jgi:Spy/CpxP family protein refolding chaperone
MKNKLSVLLAGAVLTMSLASTSTFALNNDEGHDHKYKHKRHATKSMQKSEGFMQHKLKKMMRYLDLTSEQRQQVKAIHQQAKKSRLVLKDSLQNFHQQSEILMMEDDFNEQAFIDLQSQYQDSFAQMALIKAQTKHRFIALLTEEQKPKMKSRRASEKRRPHHFE